MTIQTVRVRIWIVVRAAIVIGDNVASGHAVAGRALVRNHRGGQIVRWVTVAALALVRW